MRRAIPARSPVSAPLVDADGALALEQAGEIQHFMVQLSGNLVIPDFTHTLDALNFFR
jgi:hypothetical protein